MRQIKFRAKRIKDGRWITGDFYETRESGTWILWPGQRVISTSWGKVYDSLERPEKAEVDRNTVCQYIGLGDKNGKAIFEGDIVRGIDKVSGDKILGEVDFRDASFCILGDESAWYGWIDYEVEVIGNIFDNPELLEGGDE